MECCGKALAWYSLRCKIIILPNQNYPTSDYHRTTLAATYLTIYLQLYNNNNNNNDNNIILYIGHYVRGCSPLSNILIAYYIVLLETIKKVSENN